MSSVGRVTPDDGLRVRTGPGPEHGILGALEKDEEVVLILSRPDTNGDEPAEETYTCVDGDTLFGIGTRFGIAFMEIAALNGLVEPFTLQIGQVLRIPGGGVRPDPTPAPRPAPVTTTTLSLLNPFAFAGGTQVTSSSLQGHHMPFLGACSCDLDVQGVSSPGTPVHFNAAGPEGVELRGVVRETGLACKSQQLADGGRTVKLAIQKRQDGGDWTDTGAWILYAHLDPVSVKLGDVIGVGGAIGRLGPEGGGEYNSSCAQGSHVHMEAHRARCVVNAGAVINAAAVMTLDV